MRCGPVGGERNEVRFDILCLDAVTSGGCCRKHRDVLALALEDLSIPKGPLLLCCP